MLFLCENNLYAMGTRLERAQSQTDLAAKARSYLMPAEAVDGMDVLAVEAATRRAADAVRRGEGPAFLEFRTYRFRAHSMFDAELYREKSEVEAWKARDPIATFTARLKERGFATDDVMAALETSVSDEIDQAVQFAEAGTWEPVEDLLKDVYTPAEPRRPVTARSRVMATTTYREAIRTAHREALAEGPARLPDGRGRRQVRRLVRRQQGPARRVRPGAHPRHAAVGVDVRRRRHRRRARRHAARSSK